MALPDGPQRRLVNAVSLKLHAGEYFDAAKLVAEWFHGQTGKKVSVQTKTEADAVLTLLLHWCLNNDGYEQAAQLLWGPTLFTIEPESAQRVWRAFEQNKLILLMGAGSMSKSYSMGVRLFLEWVRDPEYTTVRVLGPSEKHLEDNLFTHLVTLHQQSSIPLPGQVGKLFIGLDPRARKSSISGVVIPLGQKKAGKLQGTKRFNRKVEHPVFGKMSRMYIFLDEIANIPKGIWRDIDNLMTGMGDGEQKIIGAFNPTEQQDEVGIRTEPPQGWAMFDPDADFDWTSTRGWRVVRLDAAQSENVKSRRVIYPGLQTYEGLQILIRNAGGVDSPGYWSMGRGCFPPTGVPMLVIPAGLLANFKAEPIWLDRPEPVGGIDMALEGGDVAIFAKGSFGLASGVKFPPTCEHPEGRKVMFKNTRGFSAPRYLLVGEVLIPLPKGDTVVMKEECLRLTRQFRIKPEWLAVDRTGNGSGVHDLMRHEYGEVLGVNFYEGAGETRIMAEDLDTAKDAYDRMNSELCFAVRKWLEFGYLYILPSVETERLYPQLTGRKYRSAGKKSHVEKKDDYASRNNGQSPNEADAFSLMVHAARRASGLIPGMSPENSTENMEGDEEAWENDRANVRISAENRFEDL